MNGASGEVTTRPRASLAMENVLHLSGVADLWISQSAASSRYLTR